MAREIVYHPEKPNNLIKNDFYEPARIKATAAGVEITRVIGETSGPGGWVNVITRTIRYPRLTPASEARLDWLVMHLAQTGRVTRFVNLQESLSYQVEL